ncbi:MAG: DMT family transporter [Acidimicrobiia bacterium]|nr:DMT family transporter [Acidimicrobiia bacterium]MDH4306408.1 DMT family transporter [Acidimicrobiia bacterium]MDH5293594.1 DMT family transporter [Acidimicrobiia bacterium]
MGGDHRKGLAIAVAGIVALSPESLLIRLVEADRFTILVWRGTLLCIGLLVASTIIARTPRVITGIGIGGAWVALLFGLQTVGFVVSITNTTVANTLVAMSAAPLFAALYERVLFRQKLPRRLWTVIVVAMIGITVMFSDSLSRGGLLGDLAGLGAAASFGASFVVIGRHRDRTMVPAMGLGGLVAAAIALPLADPMSVTAADVGYLAVSGLAVLPVGFGLLAVAPRYIPAPEVGLITLLEAILGPLWVWIALGEQPGLRAILGGSIVVGSLAVNSFLTLRSTRAYKTSPL